MDHGPRSVTKLAQLGKHGALGHQESLLPSAVRDKDAKGATQDSWFPQAEPGRETSFAWGHPPPASASPGQGALPMSIRPSTRTLTGWPWAGSTSRQLLFSHRQLWESLGWLLYVFFRAVRGSGSDPGARQPACSCSQLQKLRRCQDKPRFELSNMGLPSTLAIARAGVLCGLPRSQTGHRSLGESDRSCDGCRHVVGLMVLCPCSLPLVVPPSSVSSGVLQLQQTCC